ncbi:MAG: flagellar hook-associated protein FlgK [Sphingomonadales bacterium]
MTISNIITTALSGLMTNQAALRTTTNNITNVNTEGYVRQVVRQESFVVQGDTAGVRIADVERIVDLFLEAAGLTAESDAQSAFVGRQFHDRFQTVLGRPDSSGLLTARLDRIFASLAELGLNPGNSLLRQASLININEFGDELGRLSKAIQDLRAQVNLQIESEIQIVNENILRVQKMNQVIIQQRALGGQVAGLETERDRAIAEIASRIDVRVNFDSRGRVLLSTANGVALLDSQARELEFQSIGLVNSETRFEAIKLHRIDENTGLRSGTPVEIDGVIASGSLRGLLDMRDGDLRNLSLTLGELGSTFMTEVNAVHNRFSAVPAPNTLVGRQTIIQSDYPPNFTGRVTFAIIDPANEMVVSTTIDFDAAPPADFATLIADVNTALGAAGTLALTNGVLSLTATDAANGVVIADDPAAQTSRGGLGFSHFFGMNNLLEASVEGTYATGLTGTEDHNLGGGSLTLELKSADNVSLKIFTLSATGTSFDDLLAELNGASGFNNLLTFSLDADGALDIATAVGLEGAKLEVVSDSTSVAGTGISLARLFGIGDPFTAKAAQGMRVRTAIDNDVSLMALSQYIDTTPPTQDVTINSLLDVDLNNADMVAELETLGDPANIIRPDGMGGFLFDFTGATFDDGGDGPSNGNETLTFDLGGETFTLTGTFADTTEAEAFAAANLDQVLPAMPLMFTFTLTVPPGKALVAGDQRGTIALSALAASPVNFEAAGELKALSVTIGQFAAAFLGNAGEMGQRAANREADTNALKIEIDARRSDVSGVNLDEELANMVILQNSFNAAARLLTTARELFDALLRAV